MSPPNATATHSNDPSLESEGSAARIGDTWTEPNGAEREDWQWIGDIGEALQRAGLPARLAEVGTSTSYDTELRASHFDGVNRIEAEIGTPILAVTAPDGDQRAFFGPVLSSVPTGTEALHLWEAVLLLADVAALREIKC